MKRVLYVCLGLMFVAGCAQVGSMVAKFMTQSTGDLDDVQLLVNYRQNLYPASSETTEAEYLGKDWKEGESIIAAIAFKNTGLGMWKVEGEHKANGEPMQYYTNGVHGAYVEEGKPIDIYIKSKNGDETEFTINPVAPLDLKSVNGGSGELNMEEDVVVEFDVNPDAEHRKVQLNLMFDIMGTRSLKPFIVVEEAPRMTIPKEVFSTMGMFQSPNTGPNFLIAERYNVEKVRIPETASSQIVSTYMDWDSLQVTGDPDQVDMVIREDADETESGFEVDIFKKPALTSPPLSKIENLALGSFVVRATKLYQQRKEVNTSSQSNTYGNMKVTTTTTTTITKTRVFPQLPDSYWDAFVERVHDRVTDVFKKHMNYNPLPMEQVINADAYADVEAVPDCVSVAEVSKSYGGTKRILNTTFEDVEIDWSVQMSTDQPMARLIDELKTDAVIAVTLDMEMPWTESLEDRQLTPRLNLKIFGPTNGYSFNTEYVNITLVGGGKSFNTDDITVEEFQTLLDDTIELDNLVLALDNALQKTRDLEEKYKYDEIWELYGDFH